MEEYGKIIALLVFLIVAVPVLLGVVSQVSQNMSQTQCQSYITEIGTLKNTNAGLEAQRQSCDTSLYTCRTDYQRLTSENITKADIDEMRYNYNQTHQDIITLNNNFIAVNKTYNNVYNTVVYYFTILFAFNIVLSVGIAINAFSMALWKVGLADISVNIVKAVFKFGKERILKEKPPEMT